METFNLSRAYPRNDVRERSNMLIIFFAVLLLLIGVLIFSSFAKYKLESNFDALRIFAGCLCIGTSFYFITVKRKFQAYAITGSPVFRKSISCPQGKLLQMKDFLCRYNQLQEVNWVQEKGPVSLVFVYSKDEKYVAFQLLRYTSFLYEPLSDLHRLEEKEALSFLNELKVKKYEF